MTSLLDKLDALRARLETVRPLSQAAMEKIRSALAIEYTYESNRIEGSTLTLQETQLVVQEGLTIGGKTMREHLEAINHNEAVGFIEAVAKDNVEVTESVIKQIHALILRGIDRENAGTYRAVPVLIAGSRHTPPQPYLVPKLMEEFIFTFREKEHAGEHPVLIAAYLHDELVRIHPFIDGNGRTARLLMNLYFLRSGYIIANLRGDTDSRMAYYKALEQSHCDGNPLPFQRFVACREIEAMERYQSLLQ